MISHRLWRRLRPVVRLNGRDRLRQACLEPLEGRVLLSAGQLDPNFGNGSFVVSPISSTGSTPAVAATSDGKIVVEGNDQVERLDADGSIDTSFGKSGLVTLGLLAHQGFGNVIAQPDGKIVVAEREEIAGNGPGGLIRLNADGSRDGSFGSDGVAQIPGAIMTASSSALQPDGKILIAGQSAGTYGSRDFVVARYNADGTIDTTFGNAGVKTVDVQNSEDDALDIAVAPDGKIVLVGESIVSSSGPFFAAVVRLLANGTPDPTFGANGRAIFSSAESAQTVAIQADDKIVYTDTSGHMVRLDADGTVDMLFANGGTLNPAPSLFDPFALLIQPDGKILTEGDVNGTIGVARILPTGTLDPSFGGGTVRTGIPLKGGTYHGLAMEPGGRVALVAGATINSEDVTGVDQILAAPTAGAAPADLDALAESGNNVLLTWSDPTAGGISGYVIQRSLSPAFTSFSSLSAPSATATALVDQSASPGITYYYRVQATTGGGVTGFSNVVSVTTRTDGIHLVDNRDRTGQITGSWSSSTFNGGYIGQDYFISPGGPNATPSSIAFAANLAPGNYQVFLRWTASPNRADNLNVQVRHGLQITGMNVNEQSNGGKWVSLGQFGFDGSTQPSVTLTNAQADGIVVADAVEFVPVQAQTAAPTNVSAVAVAPDQADVSWTYGSNGATGFEVQASADPNFASAATMTVDLPASARSHSFTGLTPQTTYFFRVRATGQAGDSAFVNANSVQTPATLGIVVDNRAATVKNTWFASSNVPGFFGPDYLYANNDGTQINTVTFTPQLPAAGEYRVYARWSAFSNRATNTQFTVQAADGPHTVLENQQINGGEWVLLGTFPLNSSADSVSVTTQSANGVVVADAVHLVPASAPSTVIVDDPQATLSGSWQSSTFVPGFFGSDYLQDGNTGKGTKSVTFTPNLPTAGTYNVFARWTADTNRATNVPFDVLHQGTVTTVLENEQVNGGQWVLLGTFTFDAGTGGSVKIRNDNTNGFVIADAVMFSPA